MPNLRHRLPSKPDDVIRIIDDIDGGLDTLRGELRWVHSVMYGRNPGPSAARQVHSKGADPTGELVVNQEAISRHYRAAVAEVLKLAKGTARALEDLRRAVDAADRSEDLRLLPREYDVPRGDVPLISKKERERAERYQQQRHAAGQGFGES